MCLLFLKIQSDRNLREMINFNQTCFFIDRKGLSDIQEINRNTHFVKSIRRTLLRNSSTKSHILYFIPNSFRTKRKSQQNFMFHLSTSTTICINTMLNISWIRLIHIYTLFFYNRISKRDNDLPSGLCQPPNNIMYLTKFPSGWFPKNIFTPCRGRKVSNDHVAAE